MAISRSWKARGSLSHALTVSTTALVLMLALDLAHGTLLSRLKKLGLG